VNPCPTGGRRTPGSGPREARWVWIPLPATGSGRSSPPRPWATTPIRDAQPDSRCRRSTAAPRRQPIIQRGSKPRTRPATARSKCVAETQCQGLRQLRCQGLGQGLRQGSGRGAYVKGDVKGWGKGHVKGCGNSVSRVQRYVHGLDRGTTEAKGRDCDVGNLPADGTTSRDGIEPHGHPQTVAPTQQRPSCTRVWSIVEAARAPAGRGAERPRCRRLIRPRLRGARHPHTGRAALVG